MLHLQNHIYKLHPKHKNRISRDIDYTVEMHTLSRHHKPTVRRQTTVIEKVVKNETWIDGSQMLVPCYRNRFVS